MFCQPWPSLKKLIFPTLKSRTMIDSFLESLMFCQLWPSLKKLIFSRSHISAVSDEDRFKVRSRVAGDDGDDGDRRRHVNERRGAFLSGLAAVARGAIVF